MKNLFKSFLTVSMLLAPAMTIADSCGTCSTGCSTSNSCCSSCGSSSCNGSCSSSCNTGCNTSCNTSCGDSCNITSIFRPRPVGADTTRELVGWQDWIHRYDAGAYKTWAFAVQYERSFNPCQIANVLFGTSNLNFVGSKATARTTQTLPAGCCQLVADHFGLPTDTNAILALNPLIQNLVFDIEYFHGFDVCGCDNFYFRLHLPIVWTSWTLFQNDRKGCCLNTTAGVGRNVTFPDGYMSSFGYVPNVPGSAAYPFTSLQAALNGDRFGNMSEAWNYGRFSFCNLTKVGLSDLDLILGWDFWNSACGHFGLYLQAVVPTAPRQTGAYIFEPMVGDRHFKLGGGLSTHWDLWECDDHKLAVWLEGNVVHLFNNYQNRSFDFNLTNTATTSTVCNPLSRYMLLKEFDANGVSTGSFINAINFATRRTRINVGVEGDATLKFAYKFCNWTFDLGYNVYGKSRENGCIVCSPCDHTVDGRTFGFKGTEGLYGLSYTFTTNGTTNFLTAVNPLSTTGCLSTVPCTVNLNSTQSGATICNATSPVNADNRVTTLGSTTGTPATGTVLLTWDSAAPLTLGANSFTLTNGAVNTNGIIVAQQSVPPVTFNTTATNLNLASGLAGSQLTNKVFGYLNYAWADCKCTPFLGIGATGEWATRLNCRTNGLSKWSVIVKGGMAF